MVGLMVHQLFVLLLLPLHEVLPFFIEGTQLGFFLQLVSLVGFALSLGDVFLQGLDLHHFLLLLFLASGGSLLLVVHTFLKIRNLVNFLHGHPDGTADVLGLLPDLVDLLLALLQCLLLLVVGTL